MKIDREQIGFSIQNILDESVSCGNADGLQCAAFLNGELIVNAWAGRLRKNSRSEVGPNSLFPVFSAGKAVASAAALRLVEKGVISLDTRIADLWPEFSSNGKSEIRLHHILTHRSVRMPESCGRFSRTWHPSRQIPQANCIRASQKDPNGA